MQDETYVYAANLNDYVDDHVEDQDYVKDHDYVEDYDQFYATVAGPPPKVSIFVRTEISLFIFAC